MPKIDWTARLFEKRKLWAKTRNRAVAKPNAAYLRVPASGTSALRSNPWSLNLGSESQIWLIVIDHLRASKFIAEELWGIDGQLTKKNWRKVQKHSLPQLRKIEKRNDWF
jgi:hypothetical protein